MSPTTTRSTPGIIDPTDLGVHGRAPSAPRATRPEQLAGVRVGLLSNTKRNADRMLDAVGEILLDDERAAALVPRVKHDFAMPLAPDLRAELIRECDVVVVGVGDCGSCSAAAVADAIALEGAGVPAAVICTEQFSSTSRAMAALKGDPEHPIVLTPHPVANLTPDGIRDRARTLSAQITAVLTQAKRGAAG